MPAAIRAVAATHRLLRRALRVASHGVDALTLGLLSDAGLDALTAEHYRRAGRYHSAAHNASGLWDWERDFVAAHVPAHGRVLVTSAGAGREALALLERDLDVVATECVTTLHEGLARRLAAAPRGAAAVTRLAPPDAVPAEGAPFDAAIVGWGGYTHLLDRGRRLAFLRALRAALRPGAPLLVSFLIGGDQPSRAARAVTRTASLLRRACGRPPVAPGVSAQAGFVATFFAPGAVTAELAEAGFEPIGEWAVPYPHVIGRRPA